MTPRSSNSTKRTAFQTSRDVLSYTMSGAVAFFATGPTFVATLPSVQDFAESAYSPALVGIASVAWFIVVALSVFALSTLAVFSIVQVVGTWFGKLAQLFR